MSPAQRALSMAWFGLFVGIGFYSSLPMEAPQSEHLQSSTETYGTSSFASVHVDVCKNIFSNDPKEKPKSLARRRELGLKTQYSWIRVLEERVTAIRGGGYSALVSLQLPMVNPFGSLTAVTTGLRRREGPRELDMAAPPSGAMDEFARTADRALDFVIETYRKRRPHWTPEFLAKLRKMAIEYLPESTYITLQEGSGYRDGRIHAAIRLIRERDGFLPMEKYLGIEIDAGGRLKVEPGNFAINKELNQHAWPELLIHLLNKGAREVVAGRENHYLTYADQYSLALYSGLGFTAVPASKIKARPGVTMKDGKILVDGVWWTPMEASQQTLDSLFGFHLERMKKRGMDPDEIELLIARQAELDQYRRDEHREVFGQGKKNGQPFAGRLEINQTTAGIVRLILRSNDLADVFMIGALELTSLPLDRGALRFTGSERAQYQNGMLRILRGGQGFQTKIEIETTPDLTVVTSVRFQHRSSEGDATDLDIHF